MKNAGRYSIRAGAILLATAAALSSVFTVAASARAAMMSNYDSLAVVKPANHSTVFNNAGNVAVAVAVSPALRAQDGDQVALTVDGRKIAPQSTTHFELSGIVRGEHTIEARVVGPDGNTLISSAPVKFYMWHASRLFLNRRGK